MIGYNLQTFPPERAQRAPGVGDQVILFLDEVTPNPQSRTAIKTLQASAQAADELVALALKASQDK